MNRLKTIAYFAMVVGIALFFVFVGWATYLYPGGNRFDYHLGHYSFFGNFLCDLFSGDAYNGMRNSGRPFAIFGTYSLAAALLLFWQLIPELFGPASRRSSSRFWIRGSGAIAMAISFLIATPLHDWSIIIATPLGLTAFVLSVRALGKSKNTAERTLARLGALSIAICLVNYLSFVFRVFPASLPGVQKAALIGFLAWILAVTLRLGLVLRI